MPSLVAVEPGPVESEDPFLSRGRGVFGEEAATEVNLKGPDHLHFSVHAASYVLRFFVNRDWRSPPR